MARLLIVLTTLYLQGGLAQVFPFRDSPADTLALTNAPITLTCSAPDPSPPPSIIWLHNDIFTNSSNAVTITYDSGTGVSELTVHSVSYYDEGTYQCVAVDAQGRTESFSEIGNLTVQGHPAFANLLSPVVVPLGGEAVFTCLVLSNPPATSLTWLFGSSGQLVTESERIAVTASSLVIQDVQASDVGYYECSAVNVYGVNSTSAPLTIGVPPVILEVAISPSEPSPYALVQGRRLLLRCSVSAGVEVASVMWLKGSAPITSGVSLSGGDLLFSITAVQVEDGGTYTCTATDGAGTSASASIVVEVYVPPFFTETPTDNTIIADSGPQLTIPEIFRCQATGIPQPVISWVGPEGDVLPVADSGGQVVPVLGGVDVGREDAGVYTCVATNNGGVNTTAFTLRVLAVALITTPPRDTEAGYGQDVVFRCIAEGPPEPEITWNRTRTDGTDQLPQGAVMAGTELHLFSVTESDNGTYECTASNEYGTDTAAAMLTVLDLPRVTFISPDSVSIETGQSFSLQCHASGPSSTAISWYHNGSLVPSTGANPRVDESSGTLTVSDAVPSHSGVYSCNASTSYAFDIAPIPVTVGAAPAIMTPPVDTNLTAGGNVSLHCLATGLPPPFLTWYKTDELGLRTELPIAGETFVVYKERLEFTKARREDSGWYECVAENAIGRDIASARLRVEGFPQAVNFTPTVLIAGLTHTLTCEVIYNHPRAAIVWSRVDGTELSPRRFSVGADGALRVALVEVEDEGEYVCRVINMYGDSNVTRFVTVYVRPSISLSPSSPAILILHSSSSLFCPSDGRPAPTVSWTLPDGSTPSGNRYQLNEATGELVVDSVVPSDGGSYTCVASNVVGTASVEVAVEVKGAAPSGGTVTSFSSSVLFLVWDPPPSGLASGLQSYEIEQRNLESHDIQLIQRPNPNVREYVGTNLEEGTTYEFAVRGIYSNGITGEDFIVRGTTRQESPTGPPRNVSVQPLVEGLNVSWLPPHPDEDNGLIILYRLHYRPSRAHSSDNFTIVEVEPTSNDTDTRQWFELANLQPAEFYDVTIQAMNSVGVGPNSAIIRVATLRQTDPGASEVVAEALVIAIPIGSMLLLVAAIFIATCCVYYWQRRKLSRKHSPLMEDAAHRDQQRRHGKHMHRTITGPIPGISPNTDTSVPGKFTIQSTDGTVTSSNPTVITPEDVAPPPTPGQNVAVVPRAQIIRSQRLRGYEEGEEITPYSTVNWNRPDVRTQPILEEEEEEEEEEGGSDSSSEGGGGLSASRNALDLSNPNLAFSPTSEDSPTLARARGGDPNLDVSHDDANLLYATVPEKHRVKKRAKILHDLQKREMKARQDQRKMQERMQREQQKKDAKTRRAEEKERKRRQKADERVEARREMLGLGNVVRLHEIDPSSQHARAQAQFIDAATAAIF